MFTIFRGYSHHNVHYIKDKGINSSCGGVSLSFSVPIYVVMVVSKERRVLLKSLQ